jgi:hypothetical protein
MVVTDDGAYRCGHHDRQRMPHASPGAGIGQFGERRGQPTSGFRHPITTLPGPGLAGTHGQFTIRR